MYHEPVYERKLDVQTGTEGPPNDPYGYEELSMTINGNTVTAHIGLFETLEVNGITISNSSNIEEKFESMTGLNFDQFMRCYYILRTRCSECGNKKKFKYMSGYPGESFVVCGVCDNVIDYNFNKNAII